MLMKRLVNLIQLAVIAAIVYPIYYVWDTGRIDEFCSQIKAGMTLEQVQALADEAHISLKLPDEADSADGQWRIAIESRAAIDQYACVIIGSVDRIANAEIVDPQ